MNKLDEIKGRMESCTDTYVENTEFLGDMEYLLSRLEIAEKALEDAKHKSQILASHCAHRMDSGGTVQTSHAFEKTQEIYESIEKAIKQLRE